MRNKNRFRNELKQRDLERMSKLIDKCFDFVLLAMKMKREDYQRKINSNPTGILHQETLNEEEKKELEQTFLVKDGKITSIKEAKSNQIEVVKKSES